MKKHVLTYLLCLATLAALQAQIAGRRAGELLVQLNADASPNTALAQLSRALGAPVILKEVVAPDWRIYLFGFDEQHISPEALLAAARSLSDIRAAQWNQRASERNTEPNDTYWNKQDNMNLIGMPEVWDVSTGGLTPAGDTIVLAILEKGALLDHPDLAPNIWHNWSEIPRNGIDDDGNGYIDDYRGYDPRTKNDSVGDVGFHGTAVHGIVGARGNNNLGVAGVNWTVKLMPLANIEYESEIIAGYQYVAQMRRLYNTTNGAKGAFVVATNASFGIDGEKAADHPLWCAVYDSLGAVGVLSAGATANSNVNVDLQGDMPSTCTSQYLIMVNSVDIFDKKVSGTGYGATSVDLGAPGKGVYTTHSTGLTPDYNTFDGTSAATPHVTGAIGLIYSLNCINLTADALTQPATCARRVRDIILNSVSPNPTLTGITTTGGRLDVASAARAVQNLCGGVPTGPLGILRLGPVPVHSTLKAWFQVPTYATYTVRVTNMLGQVLHEESFVPDPFAISAWEFDASALPAGVYTLSLGRSGVVRSEKFVKN